MTVRLGTNIAALSAQRQLARSSDELQGVFQRLATGARINSASDDAAGLAIADQLRADVRIANVARRNVNDGLSLSAIATGGLNEQLGILNRLLELSEQSANGTFSNTQRQTLNREYQDLISEFGRVGDSTAFNGVSLLRARRDNGLSAISLQVGLDGGSNSILSLPSIDSGSLSGTINFSSLATIDWDRDGVFPEPADLEAFSEPHSRELLYERLNNRALNFQITDSQGREREVVVGLIAANGGVFFAAFVEDPASGEFTSTSQSQATFNFVLGGGSALELDEAGQITTLNTQSLEILPGINLNLDVRGLRITDQAPEDLFEFSGVDTSARALQALELLRARASSLTGLIGKLGAIESRLNTAFANLSAARDTFAEAESRIRDSDIALESSRLVRLQILQQVGSSVLAQANQAPSLALTLLR